MFLFWYDMEQAPLQMRQFPTDLEKIRNDL
jgi:hypothetical protein